MKRTADLKLKPFQFGVGKEPKQLLAIASSTHDDRLQHGLWESGPGEIHLSFAWSETVYILDGRAEVENLESGDVLTLLPGDFATFEKGTRWLWRIPWFCRKVFTIADFKD